MLPGGSGYFTCKQNMKLVTTKFKTGGLHEKRVVAIVTVYCWTVDKYGVIILTRLNWLVVILNSSLC